MASFQDESFLFRPIAELKFDAPPSPPKLGRQLSANTQTLKPPVEFIRQVTIETADQAKIDAIRHFGLYAYIGGDVDNAKEILNDRDLIKAQLEFLDSGNEELIWA